MRVALVTGASRGIGRAIALDLASRGFDLLVAARGESALRELGREIGQRTGRTAHIAVVDMGHLESADVILSILKERYDRLDVLVNNAGIALSKPFGEYCAADWERTMNINARAPFFLTQKCLPQLLEAKPGYVINICSVVSKKGYPEQSVYSASKHALLGLTKSIAKEISAFGIRVHAVLPGAVDTDMVRGVRPDIDAGELISPSEVASVVGALIEMGGNAVIDEVEIRRKSKPPWA
ncbi:MAG: 3-oxoacyl-ACP reductase [Spirochaetales bacterium]|nr:3-oxoacyl-ACP reductase [Spirochaetales bacterium]